MLKQDSCDRNAGISEKDEMNKNVYIFVCQQQVEEEKDGDK